jgi:L-rhamnose mutarotase
MTRRAFRMQLKDGCANEYRKRHDALWPEMRKELEEAGIQDYSIFLDETTGSLFAVQKLNAHHAVQALPARAIVRKWWEYMADLMQTNPDGSPVAKVLTEVFHMD